MPVVCWLAVWWALSLAVAVLMFSRAPELDENMQPVSTQRSPKSRRTTRVLSSRPTRPRLSSSTRTVRVGPDSSRVLSMRTPFMTLLRDSVTDPSIQTPLTRNMAEIEREKALTELEDFRLWQSEPPVL